MRPPVIRKTAADLRVPPNAPLSWQEARRALSGLPDGGLNIAHEAVDRHAAGERAGRVALRCLGAQGARREITYGELAALSSRFANMYRSFGIAKGDAVFVLCGPYSRALRRPAGRAEVRRGGVPAVRRLRARAAPP